jgi:hypothetical protein
MRGIFTDGILMDIDVSFWSGAEALIAEDQGLQETDISDAYRLGKKFLIPATVIREFRAIEGRARRLVDDNSFPFPIGGARFIPRRKFSKVVGQLKKYQVDYTELVEKLVTNYDSYRAEMDAVYLQAAEVAYGRQTTKQEFGPDFDPEKDKKDFINRFMERIHSSYPAAESLRGKFALTWDCYEIAMPRMRKTDADSIVEDEQKSQIATEEYQAQIQKKIGGFISEVVGALRQETVDICSRIINNIKDGKVVKGRTLSSLHNFIDKFSELNFVGDQKVEAQLESLRKEFLSIHTSEQISEQADLQDELKRRLNLLAGVAGDMTDINSVTGEYKRKIEWQEDSTL